jgi:hypothetical protein
VGALRLSLTRSTARPMALMPAQRRKGRRPVEVKPTTMTTVTLIS